MDWIVRSWHLFGWQENCQENAMVIFILIYTSFLYLGNYFNFKRFLYYLGDVA